MMTKILWSAPVAAALLMVSTASRAQTTPPVPEPVAPAAPAAPAPTEVRLDLVNGEVKLLALDETKSWTVEPQGGLLARAVDEGHTLRLVAQKDGIYTVRLEHNDGSIAVFTVHVGKDSSPGPAVPGPPPPPPDPAKQAADRRSADEHYYANTIDLNLEGGAGRHFGDDGKTVGFGRARVGLMLARWPVFTMIGATYEYSNLAPGAFGIQGELLHLSAGFWGQLGAEIDTHAKGGVMAALGFSVVGVEAQYRGYETDSGGLVTGFAVLGKIRVPLGVILYAVDKSRNHH